MKRLLNKLIKSEHFLRNDLTENMELLCLEGYDVNERNEPKLEKKFTTTNRITNIDNTSIHVHDCVSFTICDRNNQSLNHVRPKF